jgi:hypothetical protein
MALVINDRVKETTTTTGTGAVSLGGATTGFEAFSAGVGNSNTTYYVIAHQTANEWEVGLGTLDGDSSDLTRTTVISSSNSDSAVDFAAGTKDVFCTMPASKLVFEDANNDATVGRNLTVTGDLTISGDDLTMATNTSGAALIADGSNFNPVVISGDVSIATNGAASLAAAQTNITSILATDVKIGEDDQTKIDFETADTINFYAGNEKQLILTDGALTPGSNAIVDLGTDALEFKDAFFDGTLEADAITVGGTNISAIYSAIAGSSSIVTTGALDSGSITSGFGTIDTGSSTITTTGLITGGSLDIDNVLINGTTIGHTDDTDLITVADGLVTVAGEISTTTLDIGGTNVTTTAAELNLIDGGTARGTDALADGDGILINDGGTMKMTNVTAVKTYMAGSAASQGFAIAMSVAL